MSWQRIARAASLLFALVLLVSAFAKSMSAAPAATALVWTGAELPVRMLLVDGLSLLEALVGALLLVAGRSRLALSLGLAMAILLLVGHTIGMLQSDAESCGCFGALPVPDWVVLSSLVPGLVGCGSSVFGAAPARLSGARIAAGLLIAALSVAPIPGRLLDGGSPASGRLLRHLGVTEDAELSVIVGRWDCPHCEKVLVEIDRARRESPEIKRRVFFFLTPEDEDPKNARMVPWLFTQRIPSELWWDLLINAGRDPPAFLRIRPGLRVEFGAGWK